MTVKKSRFTKLERKELRRLAGLAYERELAKALESLEGNFKRWRKNKITAFELSELIHKFHNGIARDLWSFYTTGNTELNVKHAIAEGIILETEISPGILEKLRCGRGLNPEFAMGSDFSDKTYREWKTRDWMKWLGDNLVFPFIAKRTEDDACITDIAKREPFRLGHTMKVLNLIYEDDLYGVIVKVREGRRVGSALLCELKVISGEDRNFRPVEEYRVWFANR